MHGRLLPFLAAAWLTAGCAGNRAGVVTALDGVLAPDALKSTLTHRFCGARPDTDCALRASEVAGDVRAFYSGRGGEPVWVNGKAPRSGTTIALAALDRAAEHGLVAESYGVKALKDEAARLSKSHGANTVLPEDLARFDLDVTAA